MSKVLSSTTKETKELKKELDKLAKSKAGTLTTDEALSSLPALKEYSNNSVIQTILKMNRRYAMSGKGAAATAIANAKAGGHLKEDSANAAGVGATMTAATAFQQHPGGGIFGADASMIAAAAAEGKGSVVSAEKAFALQRRETRIHWHPVYRIVRFPVTKFVNGVRTSFPALGMRIVAPGGSLDGWQLNSDMVKVQITNDGFAVETEIRVPEIFIDPDSFSLDDFNDANAKYYAETDPVKKKEIRAEIETITSFQTAWGEDMVNMRTECDSEMPTAVFCLELEDQVEPQLLKQTIFEGKSGIAIIECHFKIVTTADSRAKAQFASKKLSAIDIA